MHPCRRLAILFAGLAGAWASTIAAGASGSSAAGARPLPVFPQTAFEQNLATAQWMTQYDRRARQTFDLVMRKGRAAQLRLSPVWFCVRRDGTWWAVYGRMSEGAFIADAVFEEVQPNRYVERPDMIEPRFATLARALADAQQDIAPSRNDLGIRYNFYVRAENGGIEVWVLPGYQRNGVVGYGGAARFEYDRHAQARRGRTDFGGAVRGVRASPELDFTLTNHDEEVPSVPNIYLVLNHRHRFRSFVIQTVHFTSTLTDGGREGEWRHARW